jgi:hypothetical protein
VEQLANRLKRVKVGKSSDVQDGPLAIDCSFLASEFRFRTQIALPIAALEVNSLMNQ